MQCRPIDPNKPIVKIIVAGSRSIDHLEDKVVNAVSKAVGQLENQGNNVVIINGMASKGPDRHGDVVAEKLGLWQIYMPANWDEVGKFAGHLRNSDMADEGHILHLFWNGTSPGSNSMLQFGLLGGLKVTEYLIKDDTADINRLALGSKRWM